MNDFLPASSFGKAVQETVTVIRVPLAHNLPPQMLGSVTKYSRQLIMPLYPL